ncbi:hypothetical protein HPB47_017476, partial [Ixodes persulcatus]
SRTSASAVCNSAIKSKDTIKRLQAKVSKYRKALARLRKQQQKAPRTTSEALDMVRPHVSE